MEVRQMWHLLGDTFTSNYDYIMCLLAFARHRELPAGCMHLGLTALA